MRKFYYLRSALKGEALAAITYLNSTAANYTIAFDLVKNWFGNTCRIVYSHVDAIITIKGNNLKSLTNTIDQHVQALNSLEIPVKLWDARRMGITH